MCCYKNKHFSGFHENKMDGVVFPIPRPSTENDTWNQRGCRWIFFVALEGVAFVSRNHYSEVYLVFKMLRLF